MTILLVRGTNEYKNLHARISRARGKASEFECEDCDKKAREWAWIHDTDQLDIDNYVALCRSCHIKYDGPKIKAYSGEANGNCFLTDQQVSEIKSKYNGEGYYTHRLLADEYGVSRSHINRILNDQMRKF